MKLISSYLPKSSRSAIGGYRYFFNGQEADNEVLGEGVSLGYEFRQYDARIEKWWNIDPMADKCPGVAHNERLHNGYKKKVYLCGILT